MKNILLIVFTLFTSLQLMAQDPNITQKAEPKEGVDKFREEFSNKLDTSSVPPGVVEISFKLKFVVEKDGSLTQIEASNNEYGIGDEAIRLLKTMPKWKPAKMGEKVVRSRLTFPVHIQLSDDVESFAANLTDNELKEYRELLQSKLIETPVFELSCYQCELTEKRGNNFMVSGQDNYAKYAIVFLDENEQVNKEMKETIISEGATNPNITSYETTILGKKALGFMSFENNDKGVLQERAEYINIDGYFIIIFVNTSDENVSDVLIKHLKSSLKLKNI